MKLGSAAERVLRVLVAGPATVPAVAEQLGLTQVAVRKQLDSLAEAGLVVAADEAPYGPRAPRRRGRPARVYSVTTAGREALGQNYDDLAAQALRFLAQTAGEQAVVEFARQRAIGLLDAVEVCDTETPADRAVALAETLSGEGFAANVVDVPGGSAVQLCQHQCPVGHVAAEFPQLCEAEAAVFSEVLGAHVTRLATLAHGDGICTTLVPLTSRSTDTTVASTTERNHA